MKATPLAIPDVLLLEPKVFGPDGQSYGLNLINGNQKLGFFHLRLRHLFQLFRERE